ncbi:MerR family transcriptional regulator [Siccirubricoccus phaeus]|uniref:MerR family transcriptional regulator n=1 Tax=Siccirubricoccus phaeus TaxID=2595053 RepID=UPI0011F2AAAA|nr:helix-turn-helix domain-containing protein [Siccirubricoccus phaeus]
MESEKAFSIGALSKATGTTVETIRWYERVGVLPAPARTSGNYRSYGTAHLERLSFVRRARELGFSLDQVRELLQLADDRGRSCEAVDQVAREHLEEVERKIAALEALRRELQDVIGQCCLGTVAECRIVQALSPNSDAIQPRWRRQ